MKEVFVLGEEELPALAEKVASVIHREKDRATVILLDGDLGAGKTTFTKTLAGVLGISKDEVHSPTFILKKEYKATHPLFKKLVHIDAYRFVEPEEAKVLRLEEDLKDPNTLIVIEWPTRMTYLKSDVEVLFEVEDDTTRNVTLTYEER